MSSLGGRAIEWVCSTGIENLSSSSRVEYCTVVMVDSEVRRLHKVSLVVAGLFKKSSTNKTFPMFLKILKTFFISFP